MQTDGAQCAMPKKSRADVEAIVDQVLASSLTGSQMAAMRAGRENVRNVMKRRQLQYQVDRLDGRTQKSQAQVEGKAVNRV